MNSKDNSSKRGIEIGSFQKLFLGRRKKLSCPLTEVLGRMGVRSLLLVNLIENSENLVMDTFMTREIKKKYPWIKIGNVVRKNSPHITLRSPYIDKIYIYDGGIFSLSRLARKISEEQYDLILDLNGNIGASELKFLFKCDAKMNMGVEDEKGVFFDCSIIGGKEFPEKGHIMEKYTHLFRKLGIDYEANGRDMYIYDEREARTELSYRTLKENYPENKGIAVIYPYSEDETLPEKIRKLTDNGKIVILICPREEAEEMREFFNEEDFPHVYIPDDVENIFDAAELIRQGDLYIASEKPPEKKVEEIQDEKQEETETKETKIAEENEGTNNTKYDGLICQTTSLYS